MTSFWKRAQSFPPILVRVLAREKWGRALTDIEIADRTVTGASGLVTFTLAPIEVARISECVSWKGIDIYDMHAYLIGCGIDFCNAKQMKRIDGYLRSKPNPNFKYLRTDKEWQSKWEPMIKRWMENCAK